MKFTESDNPADTCALPGSVSFAERPAPTAASESRRQARAATRILVVDDEPTVRRVLVEILRHAGYQVDAVEGGFAGWDALGTGNYQLLVTDYCMPDLTGVELIQRLRAAGIGLPCLLASGALPYATPDLPDELQPGATLQKPFFPHELVAKVDAVLRAHLVTGGRQRVLVPA